MKKDPSPSEQLTEFLNYLDRLSAEYKCSADVVKQEERKLQDFVHAMEFAADKAERTGLRRSCTTAGSSGGQTRIS